MKIPRQHMPERPARACARTTSTRSTSGSTRSSPRAEALRCLECAKPDCIDGCPVGVDVKEFVDLILEGDYLGAAAKIREDNVLPAITGRVCPQEEQCEGVLPARQRSVDSLAIGHLERFVADYERQNGQVGLPPNARRRPEEGRRSSAAARRA